MTATHADGIDADRRRLKPALPVFAQPEDSPKSSGTQCHFDPVLVEIDACHKLRKKLRLVMSAPAAQCRRGQVGIRDRLPEALSFSFAKDRHDELMVDQFLRESDASNLLEIIGRDAPSPVPTDRRIGPMLVRSRIS